MVKIVDSTNTSLNMKSTPNTYLTSAFNNSNNFNSLYSNNNFNDSNKFNNTVNLNVRHKNARLFYSLDKVNFAIFHQNICGLRKKN
jgi:hypothetical protein